jgi:hypothetical protein
MSSDNEVGFRKPPKHSRFKKGQSGNPRGRPKATRNLKTDLMEELSEEVLFREGGRSQTISRQRAKAARGILSTGQAEVALLCELDKRFRIFLQNRSFRDQTFRCLPDQFHVLAMRAVALLQ